MAAPLCLMWHLWRKRNDRSFEDTERTMPNLKLIFFRTLLDWMFVLHRCSVIYCYKKITNDKNKSHILSGIILVEKIIRRTIITCFNKNNKSSFIQQSDHPHDSTNPITVCLATKLKRKSPMTVLFFSLAQFFSYFYIFICFTNISLFPSSF